MESEGWAPPWSSMPDKIVMVTGASSGIGREICLDLAKAGCRIIAAARRVNRLISLCQETSLLVPSSLKDDSSPRCVAIDLDLAADESAIDASVQKAWTAFGRIDALVNNAGNRGAVSSPLDLSEEEWNNVIKTNLTGTWLVSKSICMRMREGKMEGSVINISSISGLNRGQLPGATHYAISKGGVIILTKVMALELGVYKIRINSISPGLFKSEITEGLLKKEWVADVIKKIYPLRTAGTVNPALTSLIRYLIHDSSAYVTGNNFIVDAGATLPGIPIYSSL